MQFVNIDNIADLNDLELFKHKYNLELQSSLDERFLELDDRIED